MSYAIIYLGFDTVSTVMTFMSYELMINTDAQRKLQTEIDEMNENLGGSKVNYEQIQGMKYMDQVVCETLRKWPPAPAVDRYVYTEKNLGLNSNLCGMRHKTESFWGLTWEILRGINCVQFQKFS